MLLLYDQLCASLSVCCALLLCRQSQRFHLGLHVVLKDTLHTSMYDSGTATYEVIGNMLSTYVQYFYSYFIPLK